MIRSHSFRRRQLAMATALFAVFGANAYAQGPGAGGGPHGPQGHRGGFAEPIAQAIAQVKEKLALNTSQQVMWDNAVEVTKAARGAGRSERERVHAAMKAEVAKPEPDLAAIAAIADDAHAKGQSLRLQVRKEWLNLYATFSPAQKQVVGAQLAQRMERMEGHRARMMERWSGGKG